jgi:protein phosphatase
VQTVLHLPAGPGQAPLVVRVGWASAGAPGKPNEDFVGLVCPDEPELSVRGAVLALADGVSANGAGRPAAEAAARALLADYYATPASWSVAVALDRVLRAASDWLAAENTRRPSIEGVVAAVSGVVLRQGQYFLAHVGDTRVYRMRGPAALEQLTTDHTWPRRDMRHVLKRAVGLDTHLVVDFGFGDLLPGDTFLMASDGVWDVLGERDLTAVLRAEPDMQIAASSLVERARAHQTGYMGRNDASAIVLTVDDAR